MKIGGEFSTGECIIINVPGGRVQRLGYGWAVLVEKGYMAGGRSIIMYGLS